MCRNLKSFIENLRFTALHGTGLVTSLTSNSGDDGFVWSPQWVEDEHTVSENARGTLGNLASILIIFPSSFFRSTAGNHHTLKMKKSFTVVKKEDKH